MPRPVCGECQAEMIWTQSVIVQFDALSLMGPYQQYQGDEAECPVCHIRVVVRYGSKPSWQHFEKMAPPDPNYVVRERSPLGTIRLTKP